jgi:hypothetical protein
MSDNLLVVRWFYCNDNNLCFISKEPLDETAMAVYHSKIIGWVKVNAKYIKVVL